MSCGRSTCAREKRRRRALSSPPGARHRATSCWMPRSAPRSSSRSARSSSCSRSSTSQATPPPRCPSRRTGPMEALSAEERLWAAVRDWFEEPDGTRHAGPDVILDRLSTDDVERAWQILSSAADPLDPTATVWDEVDGREVSAVAALEGGVGAALARSASLLVPLRRVRAHGVELPWLGVFLYADAVALYWL